MPPKPRTILVADDDPAIRLLYSAMLRKMGHFTHFAKDGEHAVSMIQNIRVDAIIMDLDMPVMDGKKALKKIRELGYKTPAIIISGHIQEHSKEELDRYSEAILEKPFSYDDLGTTLESVIAAAVKNAE